MGSLFLEVESSCSRLGPQWLRPSIRLPFAAVVGLELDLGLLVSAREVEIVRWAGSQGEKEKASEDNRTLIDCWEKL